MLFHDIRSNKLLDFLPCGEIKNNMAKKKIKVQDLDITISESETGPVISITDMAKEKGDLGRLMLQNWLRSANTLDFLSEWEQKYNPDFNYFEFEVIRKRAGSNNFFISVKEWKERTNAIGIESTTGRYGGTFAKPAIAIHFANWISPKFYVVFIDRFFEYARHNAELLGKKWDMVRGLSSLNYHIHTEAVRESLPLMIQRTKKEAGHFASEADLLNEIVFGMTAKQWRTTNPELSGNIRDHATADQLHILANLEVLNAKLLELAFDKNQRYRQLKEAADKHRSILANKKWLK